MIEDRLYRLLIPGVVFLAFLTLFLWIDPLVSLRNILNYAAGPPSNGLSAAVASSGMLVIVIGYIRNEIIFALGLVDPEREIGDDLIEMICQSMEMPHAMGRSVEELTVFSHVLLDKVAPGAKAYLQRTWSHIVIADNSFAAILLSLLSWALAAVWISVCESNCEAHSPTGLVWLTIARYLLLVLVAGIPLWVIRKGAKKAEQHRSHLYEVLMQTPLMKND